MLLLWRRRAFTFIGVHVPSGRLLTWEMYYFMKRLLHGYVLAFGR